MRLRCGRLRGLLGCLLAGATVLQAQWHPSFTEYYPHHNFTFGAGAAMPKGDLGGFFENKPGIDIAYGYRFNRYFQADLGLDMVFGAAHVDDFLDTALGPVRIRDRQYFVPLGGRAILPLAGGRVLIAGGGGGAYMRYSELLRQPSYYYRIDCPVCVTRDGWGYYALVETSFFLDQNQHFRIGAQYRNYRGHTEGPSLAGIPAVETKDRWQNILGIVGFSF
ncbi:MAG: hypothetical protein ACM336_05925 [Acidobacteriota bacterium]